MFAVARSIESNGLCFLLRINCEATSYFDLASMGICFYSPFVRSGDVLHWLHTGQRSDDGPCWDRLHYCWSGKSDSDQDLSRYVAITTVFKRYAPPSVGQLTLGFCQDIQNWLYFQIRTKPENNPLQRSGGSAGWTFETLLAATR